MATDSDERTNILAISKIGEMLAKSCVQMDMYWPKLKFMILLQATTKLWTAFHLIRLQIFISEVAYSKKP